MRCVARRSRRRKVSPRADHMGQEPSLEVTGIVREDKRAPGRIRAHQSNRSRSFRPANRGIQSRPRITCVAISCSTTAIYGSAPRAIMRSSAGGAKVESACRDFFHERGFVLFDAPILDPDLVRGKPPRPVSSSITSRAQGLSDPERTALCRSGALAFGQGVMLRPRPFAPKVKDPPSPDGILDGRT